MTIFIQQLINGLTYGSLLGFIALGYTMVYGVLKLINFAHGDVVTLSAFLAITFVPFMAMFGSFTVIAVVLSVIAVISGVVLLLERFAYRPLREAPRLSLIVSALGASMVIQNAIMLIWGANPKIFPEKLIIIKRLNLGSLTITTIDVTILLLNVLVMTALTLFIKKTRVGIAIRALSIDYNTANLMGVNVNRTIATVFLIGGAIGALGGILIGAKFTTVPFNMGFEYGIKAFIAAILGGIGNIPGAMMGGLTLGIVNALCTGFISTTWANTITFLVLILLLIIRPNGIFGEVTVKKV